MQVSNLFPSYSSGSCIIYLSILSSQNTVSILSLMRCIVPGLWEILVQVSNSFEE